MLVLSRKPGEALVIGADIKVTVVEVKGNRVKVAIDAPDSAQIVRGELTGWLDLPAIPEATEGLAQRCMQLYSDETEVAPDFILNV